MIRCQIGGKATKHSGTFKLTRDSTSVQGISVIVHRRPSLSLIRKISWQLTKDKKNQKLIPTLLKIGVTTQTLSWGAKWSGSTRISWCWTNSSNKRRRLASPRQSNRRLLTNNTPNWTIAQAATDYTRQIRSQPSKKRIRRRTNPSKPVSRSPAPTTAPCSEILTIT